MVIILINTLVYILFRTYTFNDRRYGHYQPNGYGANYPGRNPAGQYPQGMPNEDRFRFDPVSKKLNNKKKYKLIRLIDFH